jgi:hypothetical protein
MGQLFTINNHCARVAVVAVLAPDTLKTIDIELIQAASYCRNKYHNALVTFFLGLLKEETYYNPPNLTVA